MSTRAGAAPSIPVVLVRLKLRLLRNRPVRGARLRQVLGAVGAIYFGGVGFVVCIAAAHAHDPRVGRAVVVIGATAIVVGWSFLPLLSFGTDETLDPARLQLLPLPTKPLMTGLLLASLIGFAPTAVMGTLAGVVVGYGSGVGAVITFVAVVLLVLLSAAAARTLATLLAATITSRRGRDVVVVVGAVVVVGSQLLRFLVFEHISAATVDHVSNVLRWLPPGALGQAIIDARAGEWTRGVLGLVPALIAVPLLLVVWARALERSLTVVAGGATSARATEDDHPSGLIPQHVPFLRPVPWGAVAAKELRYVARDPRRKVAFVQLAVFGIGGCVWIAVKAGHLPPGSVLAASFAGYLAILGAMNQFGFDGGALWIDVVAGNGIRDELMGKNFAVVVQVLPVVLAGSIVLAAASGGWVYVPIALVIAVAGMGAGLGVANVVSVRFPQRVPETKSPFGSRAGGQGCITALMFFVSMAVQGVLLAPVAIATALTVSVAPILLVVVAPACAVYGYALWRAGTGMAERWAWWRQPELLLAIDPRRGV